MFLVFNLFDNSLVSSNTSMSIYPYTAELSTSHFSWARPDPRVHPTHGQLCLYRSRIRHISANFVSKSRSALSPHSEAWRISVNYSMLARKIKYLCRVWDYLSRYVTPPPPPHTHTPNHAHAVFYSSPTKSCDTQLVVFGICVTLILTPKNFMKSFHLFQTIILIRYIRAHSTSTQVKTTLAGTTSPSLFYRRHNTWSTR